MSDTKNAISKLYNGEYYFAETPLPDTEEYKTKAKETGAELKELIKQLTAEQEKQLSKYLDKGSEMDSILYEHYFKEGFSIAIKLIFDGLK